MAGEPESRCADVEHGDGRSRDGRRGRKRAAPRRWPELGADGGARARRRRRPNLGAAGSARARGRRRPVLRTDGSARARTDAAAGVWRGRRPGVDGDDSCTGYGGRSRAGTEERAGTTTGVERGRRSARATAAGVEGDARRQRLGFDEKFRQHFGKNGELLRFEPPPVAKCCLYRIMLSVPGRGSARDK